MIAVTQSSFSLRSPRLRLTVLAVAVFVSYAYFYQAGGWNQNSRFALIEAITETGSLRIDPYRHHTGDLALWDGHYYSDKAPGEVFTALPFVAAARPILRWIGIDPGGYKGIAILSYLATVFSEGLGGLLAVLALFFVARRWGASEGGALFAATAFGFATPAWCYATVMMGHALAAAGLTIAFLAAVSLADERSPRREAATALLVGLAAGWATATEFPAAIPAAILAALAVAESWRRGWTSRRRVALWVTAGALACAALLMAYNTASFGSPFHIGYESEERFPDMRIGFFGITHPHQYALNQILFGAYRGLLPLAPLMAVALLALAWLWYRRADARKGIVAGALIVVYYVLLNASYDYWSGGWAYGPRHIVPALPFLCLGFGLAWTEGRRLLRGSLLALWAVGAALSLVAVSTTAQPPSNYRKPVTQLLLPSFLAGHLALNQTTFLERSPDVPPKPNAFYRYSWNLGLVSGLHGRASLIPLALLWIAAVFSWRALDRAFPRIRAPGTPPGTMG